MPETWRLYRRIRGGQEPALLQEILGDGHVSLQQALARLRRALDALESAWQALQAVTVKLVEANESGPGGTVHPKHG
jgi:hypothetical protein